MTTFFEAIQKSLDARWPTDEHRVNNQSYRDAKGRLNAFRKVATDRPCEELLHDEVVSMVQAFMDFRRVQGLSATSMDNDRRVLSAMFSWMQKHKMLTFSGNPASKVGLDMPPVQHRCRRPLARHEVERLLLVSRDTVIYPMVLLCLGAGLRPVGASRVKPAHVGLEDRRLFVFEKNRERVIPLSQWFCKELQSYMDRGNTWVYLHGDTATHMLADLRKEWGLPDHVTFQSLRRTFLQKLFEANVSPQMAAKIAGNSIEVIQKHYVQLETMNAKEVVDVLAF